MYLNKKGRKGFNYSKPNQGKWTRRDREEGFYFCGAFIRDESQELPDRPTKRGPKRQTHSQKRAKARSQKIASNLLERARLKADPNYGDWA